MLVGYARVSTELQNLDLQTDALTRAGCTKIFTDKSTGANFDRPGLDELMSFLREGDVLIVWRLDRLGRSLKHLIETIQELENNKIGFRCLQESIDTTTATGRLLFTIIGALAEFELNLIRERTKAGLAAARERGVIGGRRPMLDNNKVKALKQLHSSGEYTIDKLCKMFNCSRTTIYKYIK